MFAHVNDTFRWRLCQIAITFTWQGILTEGVWFSSLLGTAAMEENRLMTHISSPTVVCKRRIIGGREDESLQFTSAQQPQWQVCADSRYELFKKPCVILRYRCVLLVFS